MLKERTRASRIQLPVSPFPTLTWETLTSAQNTYGNPRRRPPSTLPFIANLPATGGHQPATSLALRVPCLCSATQLHSFGQT